MQGSFCSVANTDITHWSPFIEWKGMFHPSLLCKEGFLAVPARVNLREPV